MYIWQEAVAKMIDLIEQNPAGDVSLIEISAQAGYSPYYCSAQFRRVTGMTLRTYTSRRRLSKAALLLRDTRERVLDVALLCGYSSQEAFTRAFTAEYGITPAEYRKNPRALPLLPRREVLFPEYYENREETKMEDKNPTTVRVVHIPAHKYLGVWDINSDSYCSFWERYKGDCDELSGTIDSLSNLQHPIVTAHTPGWYLQDGKRGYFYGLGVHENYSGAVPDGFEMREFPASYYLLFQHPPFDFLKECDRAVEHTDSLAFGFDPAGMGFCWNEQACQSYQTMLPEETGYSIMRPVKKL